MYEKTIELAFPAKTWTPITDFINLKTPEDMKGMSDAEIVKCEDFHPAAALRMMLTAELRPEKRKFLEELAESLSREFSERRPQPRSTGGRSVLLGCFAESFSACAAYIRRL